MHCSIPDYLCWNLHHFIYQNN